MCVIAVLKLRKCVISVLKLYLGLIFIQTGMDQYLRIAIRLDCLKYKINRVIYKIAETQIFINFARGCFEKELSSSSHPTVATNLRYEAGQSTGRPGLR